MIIKVTIMETENRHFVFPQNIRIFLEYTYFHVVWTNKLGVYGDDKMNTRCLRQKYLCISSFFLYMQELNLWMIRNEVLSGDKCILKLHTVVNNIFLHEKYYATNRNWNFNTVFEILYKRLVLRLKSNHMHQHSSTFALFLERIFWYNYQILRYG